MKKQLKTILLTAAWLMTGHAATAQSTTDTLAVDSLPTANSQQTTAIDDYSLPYNPILTSKIHLMVRPYGDRVVLRWVPEDYVSWLFLINDGVNVLRQRQGSMNIDTLAYALKPWTQEQFTQKYDIQKDANAAVAVGVLYGEGRKGEGQTEEMPGSVGANVELNGEQDISFGFAMLVAEWRPDLAETMAVGFTDRTAKRGERYDYYIQPTQWENGGKVVFEPGVSEGVVNEPYKPEPYDLEIQDSLTSPRRVNLSWVDTRYSSYEIERRAKGEKTWERVNSRPFLSMVETQVEGLTLFSDSVDHHGLWEYRVMGHDPFGELSEPSPVHVANIYDIEPPVPPQLKYIVMEHPDTILNKKVIAHIVWKNPEEQFDDVEGYSIKYYNEEMYGRQWVVVSDKLIPVSDTLCSMDVTHLKTGMLCVTAYDKSGNEASSLAQLIRITDYKAPEPPDSLECDVTPDGFVFLTWEANPADNDIDYYDLAFTNDLTHEFLKLNNEGIHEHGYIDSLALDVNQKYVYYRVRAVDQSGNVGAWSKEVRVLRPHVTPPSEPHLIQSSQDEQKGIHMEWTVGTDADMDYHVLYRRLGEEGDWQVIGRYDADSIKQAGNYTITVDDNPPYNRQQRYFYYMESFNSSPFTSSSLAVSWLHKGPKVYQVKIDLAGDYMKNDGHVKLAWSIGKLPFDAPYYYCVYRKRDSENAFVYQMSVQPEEMTYVDAQLEEGEEAEYYVMIQWQDGRQSTTSQTVKVKKTKN